MAKKSSKEEWEQRINEAGVGKYEFLMWAADGEFGNSKKCVVRCVMDRCEWSANVNSLVNGGYGCPSCAGNRRFTEDERIEQINRLEDIEFISWVDGYKNGHSKANVKCEIDGFEWSAKVSSLVNTGSGCPSCAGNRRWTNKERIEQINKTKNIEFVSWTDGYKNAFSRANLKCKIDGFEWAASVSSIVNNGLGCPHCAGNIRWTAEERIEQINKLENILFLSWVDGYKNSYSKASVRCAVDGFEWSASVNNLINQWRGCPRCAKHGYDQSKTGTLYALRSECGKYAKVGISNNQLQRHKQLERSTPFSFSCIEQISGEGDKIRELEKHFHNKYESAGFTGFDGATEWLFCTPELLEELRELEDVK